MELSLSVFTVALECSSSDVKTQAIRVSVIPATIKSSLRKPITYMFSSYLLGRDLSEPLFSNQNFNWLTVAFYFNWLSHSRPALWALTVQATSQEIASCSQPWFLFQATEHSRSLPFPPEASHCCPSFVCLSVLSLPPSISGETILFCSTLRITFFFCIVLLMSDIIVMQLSKKGGVLFCFGLGGFFCYFFAAAVKKMVLTQLFILLEENYHGTSSFTICKTKLQTRIKFVSFHSDF